MAPRLSLLLHHMTVHLYSAVICTTYPGITIEVAPSTEFLPVWKMWTESLIAKDNQNQIYNVWFTHPQHHICWAWQMVSYGAFSIWSSKFSRSVSGFFWKITWSLFFSWLKDFRTATAEFIWACDLILNISARWSWEQFADLHCQRVNKLFIIGIFWWGSWNMYKIFWKLSYHYHSVLSPLHSAHTLMIYFSNTHFNIIVTFTSTSLKDFFPQGFPRIVYFSSTQSMLHVWPILSSLSKSSCSVPCLREVVQMLQLQYKDSWRSILYRIFIQMSVSTYQWCSWLWSLTEL